MAATMVGSRPEIYSIQVLRGLAALGVVLYHFQLDLQRHLGSTGVLPNLLWGSAGVDLFFVVSGFVMVYASEKLFGAPGGARIFLGKRFIRIVPLYWLTTTIYLALSLVVSNTSHKAYSIPMVIASYGFIPWPSPQGPVEPVVGQGWTLNYEMFFYTLFALGIGLRRRAAVLAISLVLLGAVLLGRSMGLLAPYLGWLAIPFEYWSKPIVVEFLFGMLLALVYLEGWRLGRWPALVVLGAGVILMGVVFYEAGGRVAHRELRCGLPAAMIVAGAVFAESVPVRNWRWLLVLGNASYALYLLHALPIRAVRELAVRAGIDIAQAPLEFLAIDTVLAVALALLARYYIELPMTGALRGNLKLRLAWNPRTP